MNSTTTNDPRPRSVNEMRAFYARNEAYARALIWTVYDETSHTGKYPTLKRLSVCFPHKFEDAYDRVVKRIFVKNHADGSKLLSLEMSGAFGVPDFKSRNTPVYLYAKDVAELYCVAWDSFDHDGVNIEYKYAKANVGPLIDMVLLRRNLIMFGELPGGVGKTDMMAFMVEIDAAIADKTRTAADS